MYVLVCVGLYNAYFHRGIGIVNAMWSGVSVLLMITIGRFFFHEKIMLIEWVGVAFVFVGIVILGVATMKYHS